MKTVYIVRGWKEDKDPETLWESDFTYAFNTREEAFGLLEEMRHRDSGCHWVLQYVPMRTLASAIEDIDLFFAESEDEAAEECEAAEE